MSLAAHSMEILKWCTWCGKNPVRLIRLYNTWLALWQFRRFLCRKSKAVLNWPSWWCLGCVFPTSSPQKRLLLHVHVCTDLIALVGKLCWLDCNIYTVVIAFAWTLQTASFGFTLLGRLLMDYKNNIGPRTVPCGTPDTTVIEWLWYFASKGVGMISRGRIKR